MSSVEPCSAYSYWRLAVGATLTASPQRTPSRKNSAVIFVMRFAQQIVPVTLVVPEIAVPSMLPSVHVRFGRLSTSSKRRFPPL